jgi:hypothetical protein
MADLADTLQNYASRFTDSSDLALTMLLLLIAFGSLGLVAFGFLMDWIERRRRIRDRLDMVQRNHRIEELWPTEKPERGAVDSFRHDGVL